MTASTIWQRVEFGSYAADLPLWSEIADRADGPILELGAGIGRVALHLAGRGHELIALERDEALADELESAAERLGVRLTAVRGDLASPEGLSLPVAPALAIAPLHVIQVLEPRARRRLLGRLRDLLPPGGTLAVTVVDESTVLSADTPAPRILPDMRELDGWVYSSEPLWVQVSDETLTIRRVRESVSPDGAIDRSIQDEVLHRVDPGRIEREAEAAGFAAAGRRAIDSGPNEADSIAVLLEVKG
ncbi:MAG TPA: class I SAM-dependent methyltransferase [Solirubrobacterales bacterium]|nr:class I SAM-dependent methyltransferase [Solirubrobacterales bacterium]